jgi:four helix bundle protein
MRGTHHDLDVWQLSMRLVREIYLLTDRFPAFERFGLTQQMRKCAVSVPSNIAEGAARASAREFCRYLAIARGSLAELETQLILSRDLGFTSSTPDIDDMITRAFRMLSGLRAHQQSQIVESESPYRCNAVRLRSSHRPRVTRRASRVTNCSSTQETL